MAKRWSKLEEKEKRKELFELYVKRNKTIQVIAVELDLATTTVYDRLIRLGIAPQRPKKSKYNNQNTKIIIPQRKGSHLAEFIGILLGDGHLTPTQVTVTLGKKELLYAKYVEDLIKKLFKADPRTIIDKRGDRTVYFGSTRIVRWLCSMGLAYNKTKAQVNIPKWCFSNKSVMRSVIRGLFDTDGSVYSLRYGLQISLCNRSQPLLSSAREILLILGYHPSRISDGRIYLTRQSDINNYVKNIGFQNKKHLLRFLHFSQLGRFV